MLKLVKIIYYSLWRLGGLHFTVNYYWKLRDCEIYFCDYLLKNWGRLKILNKFLFIWDIQRYFYFPKSISSGEDTRNKFLMYCYSLFPLLLILQDWLPSWVCFRVWFRFVSCVLRLSNILEVVTFRKTCWCLFLLFNYCWILPHSNTVDPMSPLFEWLYRIIVFCVIIYLHLSLFYN